MAEKKAKFKIISDQLYYVFIKWKQLAFVPTKTYYVTTRKYNTIFLNVNGNLEPVPFSFLAMSLQLLLP